MLTELIHIHQLRIGLFLFSLISHMTFSRHLLGQPSGPGTWTCLWAMDFASWFIAAALPASWPQSGPEPALVFVPCLCN